VRRLKAQWLTSQGSGSGSWGRHSVGGSLWPKGEEQRPESVLGGGPHVRRNNRKGRRSLRTPSPRENNAPGQGGCDKINRERGTPKSEMRTLSYVEGGLSRELGEASELNPLSWGGIFSRRSGKKTEFYCKGRQCRRG